MDKDKIKTIGQLILDLITAVWLVFLTFLGSSCVSAGGDVNQQVNPDLDISFPNQDSTQLPALSGDILSFIIKE